MGSLRKDVIKLNYGKCRIQHFLGLGLDFWLMYSSVNFDRSFHNLSLAGYVYCTLKLGGTMTFPAGICSTMVSPSKSQRSHWEWLASRAQGSSSTSKVFRPDFQQDNFTCMGLSHWARGSSTDLWRKNM